MTEASSGTRTLTAEQRAVAVAEAAIGQLVQRYGRAIDLGPWDVLAGCFTADGFVDIAGVPRRDRATMAAGLDKRGKTRRHFFTPPLLTFSSADEAKGTGFCLVLEFDTATGQQAGPQSVDYEDTYRRQDGEWLMSERVIRRSFP